MSDDYVFHIDELVLTVPGGFRDASTQALEWSTPEGRLGLIIQRELSPPKGGLDAIVSEAKREAAAKFPAYRDEGGEDLVVGGMPARSHQYRFKHQHAVVYQHQVFVMLEDRAMILTAAGLASQRDAVDDLVARATADLRFRER